MAEEAEPVDGGCAKGRGEDEWLVLGSALLTVALCLFTVVLSCWEAI